MVKRRKNDDKRRPYRCNVSEPAGFGGFSENGSGSENAGGEISSEKIGQYSITYSGKAGQISALLSGENSGLKTLCSDIIYCHLAHTGLLYKGVDC